MVGDVAHCHWRGPCPDCPLRNCGWLFLVEQATTTTTQFAILSLGMVRSQSEQRHRTEKGRGTRGLLQIAIKRGLRTVSDERHPT